MSAAVDWLLRLWDKGGVALVMIVLCYLLLRFVGNRFVSAIDGMSKAQKESATTIAESIQASTSANVAALGKLTERVSRIEGKVEILGSLAVHRGGGQAPSVLEIYEDFEQDETPIHPIEKYEPQSVPITPAPRKTATPAKGYAIHNPRAATNKGKP